MKKNIVPTPDILGLGEFLFKGKTDWKPKAAIVVALLYLFFPIELLPDAIPVAGLFDDAGLMALALWYLSWATKRYNIAQLEASAEPPKLEDGGETKVVDTEGETVERTSSLPPPPDPDFKS